MEAARTFAEALAARLWDEWLAVVSDGEVPTFAAEFTARVTELLPRLLRRGGADASCQWRCLHRGDDRRGPRRRAAAHSRGGAWGSRGDRRGPRPPGPRGVCAAPTPHEGKPRQHIATILYRAGHDDAPSDLCAGSGCRAVARRGPADEGVASSPDTRVGCTVYERTRWVRYWHTGEWATRTEATVSRLWPAE